ncbi:MAG: hypothetical protein WCC38_00020 [Pseudonocardiaceae bacterium]
MLLQLVRDGMHHDYNPLVDFCIRRKGTGLVLNPYQVGGTPSTVWYLEQTRRCQPRPAKALDVPVEIVRAELPSPELSRYLSTAVGGDSFWVDRLPWTWQQWSD